MNELDILNVLSVRIRIPYWTVVCTTVGKDQHFTFIPEKLFQFNLITRSQRTNAVMVIPSGPNRVARRASVNTVKPPPPVRRSSSVTPSPNLGTVSIFPFLQKLFERNKFVVKFNKYSKNREVVENLKT